MENLIDVGHCKRALKFGSGKIERKETSTTITFDSPTASVRFVVDGGMNGLRRCYDGKQTVATATTGPIGLWRRQDVDAIGLLEAGSMVDGVAADAGGSAGG
ncbi:tRNA (guanine-N(7)-)-methyltransferase [Striga asiatica]|uniref:tRNA (Guanine-N(7)-)-methyltransferase n=1 Tax=Striga asiatica TaxID=4170 RepID=A0A5A7PG42_STRAF|nr:tRNA (guanine-N(7)-)-methyltransferase [Striga asiatica]